MSFNAEEYVSKTYLPRFHDTKLQREEKKQGLMIDSMNISKDLNEKINRLVVDGGCGFPESNYYKKRPKPKHLMKLEEKIKWLSMEEEIQVKDYIINGVHDEEIKYRWNDILEKIDNIFIIESIGFFDRPAWKDKIQEILRHIIQENRLQDQKLTILRDEIIKCQTGLHYVENDLKNMRSEMETIKDKLTKDKKLFESKNKQKIMKQDILQKINTSIEVLKRTMKMIIEKNIELTEEINSLKN